MPTLGSCVLSYCQERSPLSLLAGLSLIMFLAGIERLPVDLVDALPGWLSMVLFLLLVRLSDDLADIPIDRFTHPQRLLCRAGPETIRVFDRFRAGAVAVLILLQIPILHPPLLIIEKLGPLVFMLLVTAVYGGFFAHKGKLSVIAQTLVLNSSLAVLPIYGELVLTGRIGVFGGLMGLFFWSGALAHDYSHCLLDTENADPATLNPINRLDQRQLAGWSLALFLVSGATGTVLFTTGRTGPVFMTTLLGCVLVLLYLARPLLRYPSRETARPFYWFGYVFFLAPALGHLLEIFWVRAA